MAIITMYGYPIRLTLITDGKTVRVIETEFGSINVETVTSVEWQEFAGQTHNVLILHPGTGKYVAQVITPYDVDSKNLPPPVRIESYPLNAEMVSIV